MSASQLCRIHHGFMSLSWHCHETVWSSFWLKIGSLWHFLSNLKVVRHFHGRFIGKSKHAQREKCQESAMKMIWKCHEYDTVALAIVHGRFMALSTKQSSKQCRFMACSWHFPLKTISKIPTIGFIMFVSVYLSSVFFWCYLHWWFFRFRLIIFFGFSLIKI